MLRLFLKVLHENNYDVTTNKSINLIVEIVADKCRSGRLYASFEKLYDKEVGT